MATPDQYETLIKAARDAAAAVYAAGPTTAQTVATSTREYVVKTYTGKDAQADLAHDFKRNLPAIHSATPFVKRADGVVFVADGVDDVLVVVRCKKG